MQWIQQDGGGELVPILGGTAAWLFEHFVHRRGDLKKISAESLRKLLAGKSPRTGLLWLELVNRCQSKWRLVRAPVDPVPHVRHFLASLDAGGPHATAACHRSVLLRRADICARLAADRARDAQSSGDVGAASAPATGRLADQMFSPGECLPVRVGLAFGIAPCGELCAKEFGGGADMCAHGAEFA